MKEWREGRLGDYAEIQTGPFGSQLKNEQYIVGGTPVITVEHIAGHKIKSFKYPSVSDEDRLRLSKYTLKEGDVIFSRVGSVDLSAYVDKTNVGSLFSSRMLRVRTQSVLNNKYLSYFFRQKKFREYLISIAVGATMPSINTAILSDVLISFPPLPEQKAIASVLSSLDDKIDLLHRQNATLEAMAEALFRQWFIEDAKKDWEEVPLSSIANFLNGLACQKYKPQNNIDKLPVLKIRELRNAIGPDADWATTCVPENYIVKAGDVIFSWSGSLLVKIWNGEQCVLNQHLFKVSSEDYPKWFYYLWCKHYLREFIMISESHATTMGHIKRKDLDNAEVVLPKEDELEQMDKNMTPILNKIISNQTQIRTLEKLRDTLLPKLMSGEVRVRI